VKGGALRRDAEICAQREGHARPDGDSVDRSNHGLIAMKTKGHEELTNPVRVI